MRGIQAIGFNDFVFTPFSAKNIFLDTMGQEKPQTRAGYAFCLKLY
jgi:hypothetical protein